MSGLKRNIPVPESMPKAYHLLLQKEKLQKPASITKRLEILQAQQRTNYKNEYDRIQGIIEGYADRFARPGGGHEKHKVCVCGACVCVWLVLAEGERRVASCLFVEGVDDVAVSCIGAEQAMSGGGRPDVPSRRALTSTN